MAFLTRVDLERLSESEALLFAIGREEDASRIYKHASKTIANRGAARKLEALADEELAHKALLVDWLRATGGDPLTVDCDRPAEKLPDITADSVLEVVELAIGAESEAFELYSTLARRASDSKAREMFRKIAGEEEKHRRHLEREYEMLKDSVGYWFTETLQEPGYLERE
jgi:rubrerythrin